MLGCTHIACLVSDQLQYFWTLIKFQHHSNITRQEPFNTRVLEHGQEDSSLYLKKWRALLRYRSKIKNVFPFQNMKVYTGIRGITPLIFNFRSSLRLGSTSIPDGLIVGKKSGTH